MESLPYYELAYFSVMVADFDRADGIVAAIYALTNTAKIPRLFNKPEVVYISGAGKNCDSVNDRGSGNKRSSENKPAENK